QKSQHHRQEELARKVECAKAREDKQAGQREGPDSFRLRKPVAQLRQIGCLANCRLAVRVLHSHPSPVGRRTAYCCYKPITIPQACLCFARPATLAEARSSPLWRSHPSASAASARTARPATAYSGLSPASRSDGPRPACYRKSSSDIAGLYTLRSSPT